LRRAHPSVDRVPVETRLYLRHVDRRQIFRQSVAVSIGMDLRLVEIIRLGDEIVGDIAGGIDVDVRLADALEEPLGLPCPRSSQAKAPEAVRRRAQVDRENNANPGIAGVKDKSARERSGNVKSGFHPNDQKAKGKERSRADRRGRRENARRAPGRAGCSNARSIVQEIVKVLNRSLEVEALLSPICRRGNGKPHPAAP